MQLVPLASKPFYASATKRKIPKMTNTTMPTLPPGSAPSASRATTSLPTSPSLMTTSLPNSSLRYITIEYTQDPQPRLQGSPHLQSDTFMIKKEMRHLKLTLHRPWIDN